MLVSAVMCKEYPIYMIKNPTMAHPHTLQK